MEFFDTVKARASVRSFERCEIPQEHLEAIVDAGRRAPSGNNRQPWEFVIVRDADVLERLGEVQKATDAYRTLLADHPQHPKAEEARANIARLTSSLDE